MILAASVALAPGATETAFFDAVGAVDGEAGRRRKPEQAVATAFRALDRGRYVAVDGRANALVAQVSSRLSPRAPAARAVRQSVRPRREPRSGALETVGSTTRFSSRIPSAHASAFGMRAFGRR